MCLLPLHQVPPKEEEEKLMELFWMMMYFFAVTPSKPYSEPYVEDNRPKIEYWSEDRNYMMMAVKDSMCFFTTNDGRRIELFPPKEK